MKGKRIPVSPNHNNNNNSIDAKDQDRYLPIANVGRIMKKSLPSNAKISKEAKETVQECVSEFISFITGEASDKCQREKRKTVNGDDVLWAMTTLGFGNYVGPLKVYLNKYRESEGEKMCSVDPQQELIDYQESKYSSRVDDHQNIIENNCLHFSNGDYNRQGNIVGKGYEFGW